MFSLQILAHMTSKNHWVKRNVSTDERNRIFASMIHAWKTDEDLRKEILDAEAIPSMFADRSVPGMMSGMNYVLEEQDYPPLFALFKSNTTIRFTPGTPATEMDRVIAETHAVYRLLRAKARACKAQ